MRTLLSYAGTVVMVPIVPDTVPVPAARHAVPGLVLLPVNPWVYRCVTEHRVWRLDVEFGAVAGDARRLPVTPSSSWRLPETSGGSLQKHKPDAPLSNTPPAKD